MCQSDAQKQLQMDTFNLFVILSFRLELRRPPDVISRGRYLYADYQQIIFIIKGTTEKLFHSPQSSPKPKACRASYDAVPIRLLAYPNTPVVS